MIECAQILNWPTSLSVIGCLGSEAAADIVLPVLSRWSRCREYVLPIADVNDNDIFEEHKVHHHGANNAAPSLCRTSETLHSLVFACSSCRAVLLSTASDALTTSSRFCHLNDEITVYGRERSFVSRTDTP